MPRPSPEELRRRRAIAILAVLGVVAIVVIGGAVALGGSGDSESSAGPITTKPPATTLPPTTLVPLRVTAIGDSVMLGAADALAGTLGRDRTTVDAAESRQFSDGVDKIQQYKDSGELGDEVVVQLGTNGTINPDDFQRMMQILKNTKRVVIINAKVPRPWEDEVNQVLGDGVKQYKNSVLVDWHRAGGDHPEWFYDDGLHLRPDGAEAYAQLIAAKVLQGARVTTIPGMPITGIHALLYTSEPDALREVLRDVFGWDYVEAHPGWLIFKLPPAELGVHPVEEGGAPMHQLSFMCDDLDATIVELRERGLEIRGEPQNAGFGIGTVVLLPGGVEVLLYEPRHETAI